MNNVECIDDLVECRSQGWFTGSKYYAICRCPSSIVIVKTWTQGMLSRPDLGSSAEALWQAGAEEAAPIARSLFGKSVQLVLNAHPGSFKIPKENIRALLVRKEPSSFSKMLEIHTDNKVHKFDVFLKFEDVDRCVTAFNHLLPGKVQAL